MSDRVLNNMVLTVFHGEEESIDQYDETLLSDAGSALI